MLAHPLLDQLRQRPFGTSLPGPFYADPSVYEHDLERIFHRQWIFAGLACEIAEPGQYMTLTVGRSPIVVVRGRDGEVRGFFNSCRHRGYKLCDAEHGQSARLTCPYHAWSYGLDGHLIRAPRMHEGFDPEGHGLVPVHVGDASGMLFVCLADQPPPFAPFAGDIAPYLHGQNLGRAKLAHEMHLVENANWKVVMENSRECYHCPTQHPELMRTFLDRYDPRGPENDPEVAAFWDRCSSEGLKTGVTAGNEYRLSRLPFTKGAVSITMDGRPAVSRLLGDVPHNDIGSARWVHYPSVFGHALADYAVLVRMLPLGPEQTLVTTKWVVDRDAVEGQDYDIERLTRVWVDTNEQDRVIVERNQEGIRSIGYRPGPFSQETEAGVIAFVEWYCRQVAAPREARDAAA